MQGVLPAAKHRRFWATSIHLVKLNLLYPSKHQTITHRAVNNFHLNFLPSFLLFSIPNTFFVSGRFQQAVLLVLLKTLLIDLQQYRIILDEFLKNYNYCILRWLQYNVKRLLYRVPECLSDDQSSELDPLTPMGGCHTLLRIRGWGDPIQTTGMILWYYPI